MEWKFLINCADDFEAGLIMGVLEDNGIPTFKKYREGVGGYMRIVGGVGKDVDIFVPEDKLPFAKEVLEAFHKAESAEEE